MPLWMTHQRGPLDALGHRVVKFEGVEAKLENAQAQRDLRDALPEPHLPRALDGHWQLERDRARLAQERNEQPDGGVEPGVRGERPECDAELVHGPGDVLHELNRVLLQKAQAAKRGPASEARDLRAPVAAIHRVVSEVYCAEAREEREHLECGERDVADLEVDDGGEGRTRRAADGVK
ncbi:hypothetical protein BD413DRAFT_68403 [Trametes elegans]|nr:hypothetical protein BD413DRAFT_68403 [Trametes elegans]